MKVSWFHEHGSPEVLVCEETTTPIPGPGEALVRVRATGVNHVDIDVRAGTSRVPIRFPHILGREFAGEIAALGPVSGDALDRQPVPSAGGLREGDRVWVSCRLPCGRCEFCISGRDNLCERGGYFGMDLPGGYAQYVTVPVSTLNPLATSVSFEQAAASQIAFGTAWHVLITRGGLRAGQTVLIQAAGSGIGSAAVQLARLAGATVIATAGSVDKLERARELGAHHLINYRTDPQFSAQVMAITGGRGVDLVMEHVGGNLFTESLACLCIDGTMVTVGGHGGEVVPFDIIPFFRRQLKLVGSKNASIAELREVMGLIAQGRLAPVIDTVLPLEEAARAHQLVESRAFFGKVVLRC